MHLTYPGIVFATSHKPIKMRVDGVSISIGAATNRIADLSRILMMPEAAARQIFRQQGHETVMLRPSLDIPDRYSVPDVFGGTCPKKGTRVLIVMFIGRGGTITALSLCDGIISVDTGIVHGAGALGISGVALFGPFHAASHIGDYPFLIGIRSSDTCPGPCEESHRGCKEVNFDPHRVSPCFEAIRSDTLVNAFRTIARGGATA